MNAVSNDLPEFHIYMAAKILTYKQFLDATHMDIDGKYAWHEYPEKRVSPMDMDEFVYMLMAEYNAGYTIQILTNSDILLNYVRLAIQQGRLSLYKFFLHAIEKGNMTTHQLNSDLKLPDKKLFNIHAKQNAFLSLGISKEIEAE